MFESCRDRQATTTTLPDAITKTKVAGVDGRSVALNTVQRGSQAGLLAPTQSAHLGAPAALAATFAPLRRSLCKCSFGGAGSLLFLRCRDRWDGDGIELRLGVAHGLGQHRTKLVLGRRLRSHIGLWCAHFQNVRTTNLNLKAAAPPSCLNHEWAMSSRGVSRLIAKLSPEFVPARAS